VTAQPPTPDEPPGRRKGSWPLILTVAAAAVVGPVLLLGWILFLSIREPWDDMERAFTDVTIPEGYVFESEERYGATFFGDPATIARTYSAVDGLEVSAADLCTAGEFNGASVTLSDETRCRATTSVAPSLFERLVYWNSGYTVTIAATDDGREEYPAMLRVTISK
jgi:hypothetical protein